MNILLHVRLRKSLRTVAELLAGCDTKQDAKTFLNVLESEIKSLADGKIDSVIYRQAVVDFDGPHSYGMERIGFWPESDVRAALEGTT